MEFSSPMVNLYTHDLPAAVAFYGGLLGFEETFRAPTPEAPDHVELRLRPAPRFHHVKVSKRRFPRRVRQEKRRFGCLTW